VLRHSCRIAWRAVVRFFDHNGPDRAAAVSYYTLLSLLPLLVFLISLGARVLGSWDAAYQRATFLLEGVLAHNDENTRAALRQFAQQAALLPPASSSWPGRRSGSSPPSFPP
jgi:uncharacterized BrkB/YihY/UPF0761 family membrane protein